MRRITITFGALVMTLSLGACAPSPEQQMLTNACQQGNLDACAIVSDQKTAMVAVRGPLGAAIAGY